MFSINNPSYKDYCCSDHLLKITPFSTTNQHVDKALEIVKKCLGPHNTDVNNKRSQPKVSQHPAGSNSDLGTIRTMNSGFGSITVLGNIRFTLFKGWDLVYE